jgi:hypothetical protein
MVDLMKWLKRVLNSCVIRAIRYWRIPGVAWSAKLIAITRVRLMVVASLGYIQ